MRNPVLALIPLVLLLLVAYGLANYDLTTGPELPLYSSRRHDPFGTSAFRELLAGRGRDVRLLERPAPPPGEDATLIMTLPVGVTMFDERRIARIKLWVEAGNRLLVLSRMPPAKLAGELLPDGADLDAGASGFGFAPFEREQARGNYDSALRPHFASVPVNPGEVGGEATLALAMPRRLAVPGDSRLRVLAGDQEGAVLVGGEVGRGRVVLLTSPTPILNYGVNRSDNAGVLLSLLGAGAVYFDEYSLGLGHRESFLDWIKHSGLTAFVLQAILVLFLLARSARTDFPDPTLADPDAAATVEKQVRILGGLYEKTLTDPEIEARLAARAAPGKTRAAGRRRSE